MISLHETHWSAFVREAHPNSGWAGLVPSRWAQALPDYEGGSLPDQPLSRSALRAFCQSKENADEACFVACMAWGGMNRRHGRAAWNERSKWLPIMSLIRQGGVRREQAYKLFHDANVSGLGPAYYTKIIFFIRPEIDGYIFDQWTAKSWSLLSVSSFVAISSAGWVTRANNADVYMNYCNFVDFLASKIGVSGEVAEEMLFSQGGRTKQAWRRYVVAHWRAFPANGERNLALASSQALS